MRSYLCILIVVSICGCATVKSGWQDLKTKMTPKKESPAAAMVRQIEAAHGKAAWQAKKALSADLAIHMDGVPQVQGTITFTPDCSKVRIDLAGGTRYVMDGQNVWLSVSGGQNTEISWPSEKADARRKLQTWPLYIAAPFRLSDAGTTVTDAGVLPFGGRDVPVLKMTRAAGAGDWRLLYPDPENGRLRAIVDVPASSGTTQPTAEGASPTTQPAAEPQALVYTDFVPVDGVTLASRWTFYHWTAAEGITGDPIGRATLKNLQFVQPDDDFFAKPTEAADASPATTESTTQPATEPTTQP